MCLAVAVWRSRTNADLPVPFRAWRLTSTAAWRIVAHNSPPGRTRKEDFRYQLDCAPSAPSGQASGEAEPDVPTIVPATADAATNTPTAELTATEVATVVPSENLRFPRQWNGSNSDAGGIHLAVVGGAAAQADNLGAGSAGAQLQLHDAPDGY